METPVCPHCMQPYAPNAGYCTYCGSALGIAETTAYPIPVPNSPRFSERHEARESAPRPRWVRAVAVFWGVWFLLNLGVAGLAAIALLVTSADGAETWVMNIGFAVALPAAVVSAVYSYSHARRKAR